MNNLLTKIKESVSYVHEYSKHVKINEEVINNIVDNFKIDGTSHWLDSNPFGVLDLSTKEIIHFLLIYHAIGDYCLWGSPKWKIKTEHGTLDGTYAIIYLIIKRIKENKTFKMSFEEFKDFLKGEGEIPLLEDRYNNLVITNKFLEEQNKDFYDLIKDIKDDESLFDYIITNLSFFKDESVYKGETIYFYKRAQLFTSDIINARRKLENINIECNHLQGCADYKIPQVMRCLGILEFSEELSNIVDNQLELKENSEMEIEIRANNLIAIDKIYMSLNKTVTKMNINDYIWLLGQDKTKITKPYHRTLTGKY